MSKLSSPISKDVPLKMVGSTVFGRYPKISVEQTYNMIISDNFLVPYAGYKNINSVTGNGVGRGIYASSQFNHLVFVIGDGVYLADNNLSVSHIATIPTSTGDVFISENEGAEIAITDKTNLYIYNYADSTFTTKTPDDLGFRPGYLDFQNGYLIAPVVPSSQPPTEAARWRLSAPNDATSWPADSNNVGSFQTKPDEPQACIRFPGRGNQLLVMGRTVTEPWFDTGGQLFPYTRSNSYNIDYGCLNAATIDRLDSLVVWLGANERAGPVIMYTTGGDTKHISTDGINFQLAQLTNPTNSFGFLFIQDGHLIYQFTFPDDNLSYAYDFNTQKFFTICDENMDYHIAKKVVYFPATNSYYFVSAKDGNLYEFNTEYTNYDYGDGNVKEIPRIRVTPTFRLPDDTAFITQNAQFIIEQGYDSRDARVDLSISNNGGVTFSSYVGMEMNQLGVYRNRFSYWNLGRANEITQQFRFWGFGRFVVSDGTMGVYQ